ncbi:polyprenyl synthetase family protein [Streptomyces sp. NBC_00829]|uniref:polyprenyl synthetase family protein n=1 Tax=Streptomyces sp. NBC_00829 TaxID=2903679 RepID=UPI0038675AB5|nr:polyprenyl synthetase family protein [Streptomyces sp. NBC_00829]
MTDTAHTGPQECWAAHRARFNGLFQEYFTSLREDFDAPSWSRFTPACLDLLEDHSLRGGKRLRVAVLYEAGRLVTDEHPPALDAAALSIELLQTHGLIHDDIIDDGPVRRGGPSTYYAYRAKFPDRERTALGLTVLAGDLAAFLSVQVLLSARAPAEVCRAMAVVHAQAAADSVVGQIVDVERDFEPDASVEILDSVTEYKTTRYSVLAPLRLGLLAAGADFSAHDATLRRYATLCGIYEQMHDDYLDLFGDEKVVGKATGSDIREGRRNYAVRALLDAAGPQDRALVDTALRDQCRAREAVDTVRDMACRLGVDQILRARIRSVAEQASAEAASWRGHWREPAVDFFESLPLWSMHRTL